MNGCMAALGFIRRYRPSLKGHDHNPLISNQNNENKMKDSVPLCCTSVC